MKLKAKVVPYSSVVGGGVMLVDEKGKPYCQMMLMGGRVGITREDYEAVQAAVVSLVNEDGLVVGEQPDDLAERRIRANLDKMLAWMPPYMRGGLENYVMRGIKPGSFLTAILEGDAKHARMMADANNRGKIDEYFAKCRELLPPVAWGDFDKVKAWIARRGLLGPLTGKAALTVVTDGAPNV